MCAKTTSNILLFILLFPFYCSNCFADAIPVKLITNSENSLEKVDIRFIEKLFLGKTKKWSDGKKAIPLVLKNKAIHSEFLKQYVKKSVSKFSNYWKKLIFTGRGIPPKEFSSEQEVIEYIKTHPGSIGYVSADTDLKTEGIKVLTCK